MIVLALLALAALSVPLLGLCILRLFHGEMLKEHREQYGLPDELLKRTHDADYRIICELLDNPPEELLRK